MTPLLATTLTLAWRPFIEPIDLHQPEHATWLVVPLVLAIALVYKALKSPSLDRLFVESMKLGVYILVLMALAAGILTLIVEPIW